MKKVESTKTDAKDGFSNHFVEVLNSKRVREITLKSIPAQSFSFKNELQTHGFSRPFIVQGESRRFGLQVPAPTMTVAEIAVKVGADTPVRLIDVETQSEIMRYNISQYADYLAKYADEKIVPKVLNMISLEFSHTPLSYYVTAPSFVNSIDWVRCVWPTSEIANSLFCRVQKYCLAGMGGSYTDFHIDFGGTSVWYHILWGRKRFYLIPPTLKNLLIYEKWTCSPEQSSTFLGDLVDDDCYYFDLQPGQTLIIPSGWIHSVYTPQDSLVFGGNFLHSYSIVSQLQANCIETRTNVSKAFTFPQFRLSHWFFLVNILPFAQKMVQEDVNWQCEENNIQQELCAHLRLPFVLKQLPILLKVFETWIGEELTDLVSSLRVEAKLAPAEVIKQWWEVIHSLATQQLTSSNNDSDPASSSTVEFIAHIENMKTVGLLEHDWMLLVHGQAEGGGGLYMSPQDILPFDKDKYCQWGKGVIADDDDGEDEAEAQDAVRTVSAAVYTTTAITADAAVIEASSSKDVSKDKKRKKIKKHNDDSEYDEDINDGSDSDATINQVKSNHDDDFDEFYNDIKPKKVKIATATPAVIVAKKEGAATARSYSSSKKKVVGGAGQLKYAGRDFMLKKCMGRR